jgi:hypothetical protein
MNEQQGGFVYVQTNDADHNEIMVFERRADGALARLGSYLTGGKGSGAPHLPSQSSVVLADGHLFVSNAGSDDITLFAVEGGALAVVDRVASGGSAPRSVAVHGPHVYVLNTGDDPNVSAFSLEAERLIPVPGSIRSFGAGSDPAQVAFSPNGRTLLVTDRATDSIHAFAVDEAGIVQSLVTHPSSGATPYGYADGVLIVTEAAGYPRRGPDCRRALPVRAARGYRSRLRLGGRGRRDARSARVGERPTADRCGTGRELAGRNPASYTGARDAGWSSQVARRAHNPEVAGSNPAPATAKGAGNGAFGVFRRGWRREVVSRARDYQRRGPGRKSLGHERVYSE